MKNLSQIGKYKIIRKIGAGGMGEVYLAISQGPYGFVKEVALKFIISPENLDHLINEARLAAGLNHANIIQIFDFAEHQGDFYFAMEYIDGFSLDSILAIAPAIPLEIALSIILQIARGLSYAHQRGIIHRDLSPANILISREGVVKIGDFGLAKDYLLKEKTLSSSIKGRLAYLSPEQARGEKGSPLSDIFSLGIVFYELIFQKRLFVGENDLKILERVRNFNLSQINLAALPFDLKNCFLKMLNPLSTGRYQSLENFIKNIEEYLRGGDLEIGPKKVEDFLKNLPPQERLREKTKKIQSHGHKKWFLIAGVFLLILMGLIYLGFKPRHFGALDVSAFPWAEVYLKGQKIGITPLINYRLPVGRYQIKLINPQLKKEQIVEIIISAKKKTVIKSKLISY